MSKNLSCPEIDSLSFEVEKQELSGKSGAQWYLSIYLVVHSF